MKKKYIVPLTKTVCVSPRSRLLVVVTSGISNPSGQIDDMEEITEDDAVSPYLMYPNYY